MVNGYTHIQYPGNKNDWSAQLAPTPIIRSSPPVCFSDAQAQFLFLLDKRINCVLVTGIIGLVTTPVVRRLSRGRTFLKTRTIRDIISQFSEIGFSEYEAKSYLALVQKNPSTAYEIGKESGVPSSKIYEVLNKLKEKGMIVAVDEDDGRAKRYIPQHPEEFLSQYQHGVQKTLQSLRGVFSGLNGNKEASYVWNIVDHDRLVEKAFQMIESAKKVILLSLWNEELAALEGPLRAAEQRGVQIALVHFGPPKIRVGQVYYHPIEDTLYAEKQGRALVIVVDSQEVLMGNIGREGKTEGAWSRNRGFTMIAEDYVKHDIYIAKIISRFEKELIRKFGEKYVTLRNVFEDEVLS